MLSYRHSYHAGNYADVIKHICLVEILHYLTQKEKPLCYIDTHAGRGRYALNHDYALKNKEFLTGIGQLYTLNKLPEAVQRYVHYVQHINQQGALTLYPGSPWFAQQILRENDRLFLCELHPNDAPQLEKLFHADKRVKVRCEDGLAFLPSILPVKEKRALILIDPSYEVKTDYQQVLNTLIQCHKRFASACYALWYPVVERFRIEQLERNLKKSAIKNILVIELSVADDNQQGMTSSGMIIINPPWQLCKTLNESLQFLSNTLGNGRFRNEYIVTE